MFKVIFINKNNAKIVLGVNLTLKEVKKLLMEDPYNLLFPLPSPITSYLKYNLIKLNDYKEIVKEFNKNSEVGKINII